MLTQYSCATISLLGIQACNNSKPEKLLSLGKLTLRWKKSQIYEQNTLQCDKCSQDTCAFILKGTEQVVQRALIQPAP